MPLVKHVLIAGIAGGIVLNLIDTPWSVLVMVPRLQVFLDGHSLKSNVLTGPWFLLAHFVFATGIVWIYGLVCKTWGRGNRTAILAGMILLVLNRMFGFGNVLMGTLPADIFFGFSLSFAVGTIAAALIGTKVFDWLERP